MSLNLNLGPNAAYSTSALFFCVGSMSLRLIRNWSAAQAVRKWEAATWRFTPLTNPRDYPFRGTALAGCPCRCFLSRPAGP